MSTVSKELDESMDDQSHASRSSIESIERPSSDDDDDDDDFKPSTKSKMPKKPKVPKAPTKAATKKAVTKKHITIKASKPKAAPKKKSGAKGAGADKVKGDPKAKIIKGLLELRKFNIFEASKVHAAMFADYKNMRSAGFTKALKELKNSGLIEFPSKDTVRLTTKGASSIPDGAAFENNEEALERLKELTKQLCGKTGSKIDQIISFLSDGEKHTLKDVAAATGYTNLRSAGLSNVLAELGKLDLIVREAGSSKELESIKLANMAFPLGRPGAVQK